VGVSLLVSVLVAARQSKHPGRVRSLELRLWWGMLFGIFLAAQMQILSWRIVAGLAPGRDYAFVLLRDYTAESVAHTSLVATGFALLLTGAWIGTRLPAWQTGRRLCRRPWVLLPLMLVLALAPAWLYRFNDEADGAKGFWTRVDRQDIANLRRIEAEIPEWEAVLAPAKSWQIAGEKWIIPQGATASVLPFARSRFVFNASLGYGIGLNWRDLNRFCKASSRRQAEFLRGNDVHWILLKSEDSASRDFFDGYRLCGNDLESLGAEYPPVAHYGDQSLYRIVGPWSERDPASTRR
jgi:hypothetical protein